MSHRWAHKNLNTDAERARAAKYAGAEHQAAKKHYKTLLERGVALGCWRCGKRIIPGQWNVGHDDVQVNVIRGPECIPCNRGAANRKGALIANAKRSAARQALSFVRPRR